MARPSKFIKVTWTHEFAYAIGLLTSDGNLSPNGRHINLTSQDKEITEHARDIFAIDNKIGRKGRGGSRVKKYYVLQFGSVQFYAFLLKIGLTPAKSKTLGPIDIPGKFFGDFIRGCFDGDGNISEQKHPESEELQLRFRIASASPAFLEWLLAEHRRLWHIKGGWIYTDKKKSVGMLCFGKKDSIEILNYIYRYKTKYYLKRKYAVAEKYLGE
ncbi:MAG: LAGLIDADG family homing endonuclease [Candidatus Paceibacterota bacterium]|jgi:hypothetical protein